MIYLFSNIKNYKYTHYFFRLNSVFIYRNSAPFIKGQCVLFNVETGVIACENLEVSRNEILLYEGDVNGDVIESHITLQIIKNL